MPIELGIWRIDGKLQRVSASRLESESKLEDFLEQDPNLLGSNILIIGRQVTTGYGKKIDLLGINADGQLVVIELKRDRTPRDVVAQLLDYGSWVRDLSYEEITETYEDYAGSDLESVQFEQAFSDKFGASPPETLNEGHQLIVVASELDPSTERIMTYLAQGYGVPINAIFFQYFNDGGSEYLTRTWLHDPREVEAASSRGGAGARKREPWNGQDFYVSLGEGRSRNWEDCVRYGFISGGQGIWYSRTLEMLFPGARVFVCIPGNGYVGVGAVKEESQRVRDFTVELDGKTVPILEAPLVAPEMDMNADNPERSEYLVSVEWIKTLTREKAIWETGMFANQNTVCRLRNKFTLERLLEHFELEE
jgi:hypothetical protein